MNCPVIKGSFFNDTRLFDELMVVPIAPLSKIDTFLHIIFISQVKINEYKRRFVANDNKTLFFLQKREYQSTYLLAWYSSWISNSRLRATLSGLALLSSTCWLYWSPASASCSPILTRSQPRTTMRKTGSSAIFSLSWPGNLTLCYF